MLNELHGLQVDVRVTAISYATQELSNLEHFIRTTKPSRPHAQSLTVSPTNKTWPCDRASMARACYCLLVACHQAEMLMNDRISKQASSQD